MVSVSRAGSVRAGAQGELWLSMAIKPDDFAAFMERLSDPAAYAAHADVADMLATQFGVVEWASRTDAVDAYVDVMARRFSGEPDGADLERVFQGFCTDIRGGSAEAVDQMVEWLGREMRTRQWDRYSVAEHHAGADARYRLNYVTSTYEWEDPQSPGRWVSEAEFSALRADGGPGDAAQFSEPTYDGNYRMWYRYDHNTGAYQYAEGVPESAPDATAIWMDQATADERIRAQSAATSEARSTDELLSSLREQVMEPAMAKVLNRVPAVAGLGEERLREILAEVTADRLARRVG